MSKSLETGNARERSANRKLCYSHKKNKHKRVLKSRENIFKPKCSKELKKKLKKYKLRRDGIEDPDILDVSKILVTSLRIKSPNNQDKIICNNNIIDQEELKQGNYLIRMVRRKKSCSEVKPLASIIKDTADCRQSNDNCRMAILAEEVVVKKQMDAFKLMMDARNKSIGSNSPGKEKIEEQESNEIEDKKEIKAKRNLALQKMALFKGSQKNKEIEELRDKCIETKLVKRAEKFKQMITSIDSLKSVHKTNNMSKSISQTKIEKSDLKTPKENNKTLKLSDIFNDKIGNSEQSKKISTEDIEFLKKLSPSIKKKENMLSYFQKVPKEEPELPENKCEVESEKGVIKLKFNMKHKKKKKNLKLTEELETTSDTVKNKRLIIDDSNETCSHKRNKRKRNLNIEDGNLPPLQTNDLNSNIESRPKRNVKKPLKYTEDVHMFSSDEEFHIFTPKKKKNNERSQNSKVHTANEIVNIIEINGEKCNPVSKDTGSELSKKNESKNKLNKAIIANNTKGKGKLSSKSLKLSNDKKALKLAPIFVSKKTLSPADNEAKQKFLQSGVPEKLKKKVQLLSNQVSNDIFPPVVHVQQKEMNTNLHQEKDWFNSSSDDELDLLQNEYSFKNLLALEEACYFNVPVVIKQNPEKILRNIKFAYPKFPVYRTYHLLSGKSKGEFKDCTYPELDNSIEIISGQSVDITNDNPDKLNWCDKYKPTSSKQIIGNFEIIKELKRWLETWTENVLKEKQAGSDSSDFSDFYHSDTDSRDVNRNANNVLILTGKTGSGKTSSVHAVASELAIKVIEVNASSKRTGKIMLQDLQEATQSHKVDRAKSGSDNSQKLQEEIMSTNIKKRGRPKKARKVIHCADVKSKQPSQQTNGISQSQIIPSQESVRTGMSLILIDDADIIFEQDDGFCSAVAQLIQSSKRPVILVTSSVTCPHLQRFLQYGKVLHMRPVLSKMLGTWLDIMCLVDVGKCCTGLGAKMLDFYKGDIRKTINCLQFYMNSYKHANQEVSISQFKHEIEDEDSNMSWLDSENSELPQCCDQEADVIVNKQLQLLHVGCPLNLFNIWWNLPELYKDSNNSLKDNTEENLKIVSSNYTLCKQDVADRLDGIAQLLDIISAIDNFDQNNPGICTNISSGPWCSSEYASLLDNENLEYYNKSSLVTTEISDGLIKRAITEAQRVFKHENSLNFQNPCMSEQRNRDRIVSRHITLSSNLHQSAALDRRAIALDYWPMCRTICRIEKNRTDTNVKRKNRFCHYLKSLNVTGKSDFFDSLADSLT